MARGRARFTTDGGSEDERAESRDRFDLEAGSRAPAPGVAVTGAPPVLSVYSDIREEGDDDEANETDPFLPGDPFSPRKPFRVGSVYGSTNDHGSPHYIQLQGAPTGLARNESIFKLSGMIDDKGGEYERYRMSPEQMKGMKRKVKEFYETQNEILDGFAEVDEILDNTRAMAGVTLGPIQPSKPSAGREEAFALKVKLVINVNFLINFILLGAKIVIVLASNSMSLIASTVDSAMDFLSTLIIFGTSKVVEHKSWKSSYNYPTGKKRMEPVGVLVFSVFMIASLQVFIESVQRLLDSNLEAARLPPIAIATMIATILIKSAVWVWCRAIKNSSVEALAQDAENDIVLNFFSLLFPYVGDKLGWRYLDPLGGALLSVYVCYGWTFILLETVAKLTGMRGTPPQHQRVAYLLTRFSPLIKGIQHLSVYHTGDSYIVEADVVLPSNTDLTMAHNVAESAQYALEQLGEGGAAGGMVTRAYCHVDVTFNPLSGHMDR